MRAQDVSANEEGKRKSLHHKQRMVYRDSSDSKMRIYVFAKFCACASNANEIRRSACEGLIMSTCNSLQYMALLSIENAEPVSMSASKMRTPAISANATTSKRYCLLTQQRLKLRSSTALSLEQRGLRSREPCGHCQHTQNTYVRDARPIYRMTRRDRTCRT